MKKNIMYHFFLFCFLAAWSAGIAEESQEYPISSDSTINMMSPEEIVNIQDSIFMIINHNYMKIKPIVQKSCFDCHSEYTEYPWYYKLPLINGMIKEHVKEGREYLDFSYDFPFSGKDDILEILENIKEEVQKEDMPLFSYRLIHWGKLIKGVQQDSLFEWVDNSVLILTNFYNEAGIPIEADDDSLGSDDDEDED